MRRILLVLVAAAIALAGCGDDGQQRSTADGVVVQVGEASVRADLADDPASRQRGLSGRENLGEGNGMLFLLPDDSPSFWMKDMRFPIDILWIRDGRVVDVSADVPPPRSPNSPLPTYSPDRPADRALEVNAGWAADHGIRRGDVVRVRGTG